MENRQQQPVDQPDGDAEGLADAIAGLRMVLRPLIRNPADLEDVLQSACVRLVQASRTDGGVRCPQAFLRSVWRGEFAMVCRERARRQESGEICLCSEGRTDSHGRVCDLRPRHPVFVLE